VVAVAFQSVFHVEMHQNDVFFLFLKIIFEISVSKRSKTYKKLIFSKKNLIFWKCGLTRVSKCSLRFKNAFEKN
jgi:hypothetical protein